MNAQLHECPRIDQHVDVRSVYIALEDIPLDVHLSIFNEWNARRGDRLAPAWGEYSILDFPSREIPCASLTDLSNTPLSSVYTFWGAGLTDVFGGDFTGKTPAEVPPASLGISTNGGCARLVNDRAPNYEVKEFLRGNGVFGRAMVLRLPFSDDGISINHGVNLYKFERRDSKKPLKSFFDDVFSKLTPSASAIPNLSAR